MTGKELFSHQMDTISIYNETINYLKNNFGFSNATLKNIDNISEYLALYEVVLDTQTLVRDICDLIIDTEKVETIEENLKNLRDTFWD